jgi:hypothetical protein
MQRFRANSRILKFASHITFRHVEITTVAPPLVPDFVQVDVK